MTKRKIPVSGALQATDCTDLAKNDKSLYRNSAEALVHGDYLQLVS